MDSNVAVHECLFEEPPRPGPASARKEKPGILWHSCSHPPLAGHTHRRDYDGAREPCPYCLERPA